jgi:hypothetical protein
MIAIRTGYEHSHHALVQRFDPAFIRVASRAVNENLEPVGAVWHPRTRDISVDSERLSLEDTLLAEPDSDDDGSDILNLFTEVFKEAFSDEAVNRWVATGVHPQFEFD